VYVSTAYSQYPYSEIKEEMYPLHVDYKQIFVGKKLEEEILMEVW
jgi:hypothetical protein